MPAALLWRLAGSVVTTATWLTPGVSHWVARRTCDVAGNCRDCETWSRFHCHEFCQFLRFILYGKNGSSRHCVQKRQGVIITFPYFHIIQLALFGVHYAPYSSMVYVCLCVLRGSWYPGQNRAYIWPHQLALPDVVPVRLLQHLHKTGKPSRCDGMSSFCPSYPVMKHEKIPSAIGRWFYPWYPLLKIGSFVRMNPQRG